MMNKASHTDIAQRAYAIWEREGRPHGRDFDHWIKAEREIASTGPVAMGAKAAAARARPATANRTTARGPKSKKSSS